MMKPCLAFRIVLSTVALAAVIVAGCSSQSSPVSSGDKAVGLSTFQRSAQTPGVTNILVPPVEEVWVIGRDRAKSADSESTNETTPTQDDTPGSGALVAKTNDGPQPFPLKHTEVHASIAGYIATTDVTQQFENPYAEKIEAVYVFPLPADAAVNDFVMTIGDRHIRGVIREREEAKKVYEQAKRQGYVTSLLTQERPNIFTQSVANIEPGKRVDVDIKYFNTLAYSDGWFEYVFPMVVGPRFNPPGTTGQPSEPPRLKPAERSSHDIALAVTLDAGVGIENVVSVNHDVSINRYDDGPEIRSIKQAETAIAGRSRCAVRLADPYTVPNRDFVLRFKVAGDLIKSAVMTQRTEKSGYFTLMLVPPESIARLKRQPLEMVFTLDVSGSMRGQPLEQAKAAIRYALNHMDARDTFQVICFANDAQLLSKTPLPVTSENVAKALHFIEAADSGGGTMMMEGIRASLGSPADEGRLRFVNFLTDGFIGNEADILGEVHRSLGQSRIFSFGVGSSTNRYLLDEMAKMGQGGATYLSLNDDAEKVMANFFDRISHPAMTNLHIDYGSMEAAETLPSRTPELFVGRPTIVTGRFTGHGKTTVRVTGTVAGQTQEITIPVDLDDAVNNHPGVASVWARGKIADFADSATWDTSKNFPDLIRTTALEYGLASDYTSFLAVDAATKTTGDHGTTVVQPVPLPEGVRYDTTVNER